MDENLDDRIIRYNDEKYIIHSVPHGFYNCNIFQDNEDNRIQFILKPHKSKDYKYFKF